jgi:hypothetical protein
MTSGLPGDARPDAEAGLDLIEQTFASQDSVAAGIGVARWWLLTLPLAMVAGAGLLLAMGSKIDQDNPLLFLVLLLELSLAAGIVTRKRLAASGLPAVRR